MKRKFSDRANWRRIIRRSYTCLAIETKEFHGLLTFYHIHDLRDALYKEYQDRRLCLADKGYLWMQHYPKGEHYVVTTMFDEQGKVIQWYIDICKNQGLTEQKVPWFDDLYLDIVVLPTGEVYLMDEDELEEAFKTGDVSSKDVIMAKKTANKLLSLIKNGKFRFFTMSMRHKRLYQEKLRELSES